MKPADPDGVMNSPVLFEPVPFPDPTEEMLASPEFEAVWQCIKHWDISVPGAYGGYCGAIGNHVRAILDALERARPNEDRTQR